MVEYRRRMVQSGNNPDSFKAVVPIYICDMCGCEITDTYYNIHGVDICDYCYDTADTKEPESVYYPISDFEWGFEIASIALKFNLSLHSAIDTIIENMIFAEEEKENE